MKKTFQSAYEKLANSRSYVSVDFKLKIITWITITLSAASTAIANGLSHKDTIGDWAWALGISTFLIVEGSLYTLEQGLRETFKGGTQRTLAALGKWIIKATMVANAAYLCCLIAGLGVPDALLFWNRWSFAVHFAIGLVLIPLIRDSDPVVAARMLQLRAETAQEDQIIARLASALASPIVMACVRLRGAMDGLWLGLRLLCTRQGFSVKNYVGNLNSLAKSRFAHIEGRQHKELQEPENPFPRFLPSSGRVSSGQNSAPLLAPIAQNLGQKPKVLARSRKPGSGGGVNLPNLPNIQFEPNSKGGIEAWFYPPGSTNRKERTYLKHFGQKELSRLSSSPDGEEEIQRMIEGAARQKGITL